jgi:hypothetical protein
MPDVLAELEKSRAAREAPTAPPPWLAALQTGFSAAIRAPLDRETGTLTARPEDYPPDAVAEVTDSPHGPAPTRLAVYNRQYWFRLFTVMHTAFPLTASLLGHWAFNGYAQRFFLAHPPPDWDLDGALDGFEDFLPDALDASLPRAPLAEAARIDAVWRKLFRAPSAEPFRPTAAQAAGLLDARLVPAPGTAVLSERWPLLELKRARAGVTDEEAVALPPRLDAPRWWALLREPGGIRQVLLEPREAELFTLLARHTVREALALLESSCEEAERAALPAQTQRWLAQGVARGMWCGLAEDEAGQRRMQV